MNNSRPKAKHLAILVQPFLNLILNGEKTIETRFSKVKCAPFQKVKKGDIILLKKSAGPVVGEMIAGNVKYFSNPTPQDIEKLKKYSSKICADYEQNFWEKRKNARYISLIHITNIHKYEKPYTFPKKDRRGWIVLENLGG